MKRAGFSYVDILLLTVVIIWGTVFSFGKIALREFDPATFAALRTIMAAPILLLAMRIRENCLSLTRKELISFALLGFLGQFINRMSFSYGLSYTTASSASIIMGTTPVFTVLFALCSRIERVTAVSAAGIISAFIGVSLVVKGDWSYTTLRSVFLWGDLFILGAAASWALFTVVAKQVVTSHGILRTTAWSSAFGALFMLPVFFTSARQGDLLDCSFTAWLCVLYVSLLANALAHILWITGISRIGPTKTTIYQTLVPIVAILFARSMLSEPLLSTQIAGVVLILGGVYLTRFG